MYCIFCIFIILNAARIPADPTHHFPLLALPVCISDTSTIRRAPLGERAPWGGPWGPLWGDGNFTGDSWQRRGGNKKKHK